MFSRKTRNKSWRDAKRKSGWCELFECLACQCQCSVIVSVMALTMINMENWRNVSGQKKARIEGTVRAYRISNIWEDFLSLAKEVLNASWRLFELWTWITVCRDFPFMVARICRCLLPVGGFITMSGCIWYQSSADAFLQKPRLWPAPRVVSTRTWEKLCVTFHEQKIEAKWRFESFLFQKQKSARSGSLWVWNLLHFGHIRI